jgi:hypothetical protein
MITIDFYDGNRFLARQHRSIPAAVQNATDSDIRATVCTQSAEFAPNHAETFAQHQGNPGFS